MLINSQTLCKIEQIETRYRALQFIPVLKLDAEYWDTRQHFRSVPQEAQWQSIAAGTSWGGDWMTRWFRTSFIMPEEMDGRKVFVRASTGAPENLVIVDGEFKGVLGENYAANGFCRHVAVCLTSCAKKGQRHELALESYGGHSFPGSQPDAIPKVVTDKSQLYEGIELAIEREEVTAFVFDLMILRQTMSVLPDDSLHKHEIARVLEKMYSVIVAFPAEAGEQTWHKSLQRAHAIIKPLLKSDKADERSLPYMGLIGHSHLDTAWHWTVAETTRKCARTFSSVLNLMEQYPEFIFIQSAPYHADITCKEYPAIFNKIKERVKEGRWEPNGAMWIEPDCNVPSGESLVRQLLIGQQATQEMFGYTADTLWLPDVFGYSGALPQILTKAGVKYFCTTKMGWGEIKFPYDSFMWQGIDGTEIPAHLHKIHFVPEPKALGEFWRAIQHKDAQDSLLCPFGFGDGGAGPHAEMLEVARRVKTVKGVCTSDYTTVSRFMTRLAQRSEDLPVWAGELYLSAHRGTFTSIAAIKCLNRQVEFALRDAEFFSTLAKLNGGKYPALELETLWKSLLLNQFHDILPGTSIAEVNDLAQKELSAVLDHAENIAEAGRQAITDAASDTFSIFNTLSWARRSPVLIADPGNVCFAEIDCQPYISLDNEKKVFLGSIPVPAMGAATLQVAGKDKKSPKKSPFICSGNKIESPLFRIEFDDAARIVSCVDKRFEREIVRHGGIFNRILVAEDVPAAWDNWDINEDHLLKEDEAVNLVKRKIVSEGPVALCIRIERKIGRASSLCQDMVLYADSPRIDFITRVDWHDKHTLLKAGFDIDLNTDTARYEIQYGHLERARHTNLKEDRAKFEVAVHKWMDVSENRFGIALLNDCKYGAYVGQKRMTLSLIKSGTHPDARGDEGIHHFTYSVLPHGAFSADVIHAGYELNTPMRMVRGTIRIPEPLLQIDKTNVIIENVKWAERGNAFVIRLYEAERTGTTAVITFGHAVKSVAETDLLEEHPVELPVDNGSIRFYIRPFEIKTLVCHI